MTQRRMSVLRGCSEKNARETSPTAALQAPEPDEAAMSTPGVPEAPEAAKSAPAERVSVTVERMYLNPKLIGIRMGDAQVMVRVRDNTKFRRGMAIEVVKIDGEWVLAKAEPKYVGRW